MQFHEGHTMVGEPPAQKVAFGGRSYNRMVSRSSVPTQQTPSKLHLGIGSTVGLQNPQLQQSPIRVDLLSSSCSCSKVCLVICNNLVSDSLNAAKDHLARHQLASHQFQDHIHLGHPPCVVASLHALNCDCHGRCRE